GYVHASALHSCPTRRSSDLLFAHALHALGFQFRGLAARVVYNAPVGTIAPRGHMLIAIDLHGETFVADVGFGGLTLTSPLRLERSEEHTSELQSRENLVCRL